MLRILGVDAGFDGPSAQADGGLPDGQMLAGGDADYLLDEIDAGDESVTGCSTWRRVFISRK